MSKPGNGKKSYELVPTAGNSDSDNSEEEETLFQSKISSNNFVRIKGEELGNTVIAGEKSKCSNRFYVIAVIVAILAIFVVVVGFVAFTLKDSNPLLSFFVNQNISNSRTPSASPSSSVLSTSESITSQFTVITKAIIHPDHTFIPSSASSASSIILPSNTINSTHAETIHPTSDQETSQNNQGGGFEWHRDLYPASTELSILVHDINRDGIPDLMLDAMTDRVYQPSKYRVCPNEENLCMDDFGFSPCRLQLIVLDGRDGSTIWSKWLEFSIFASNCGHDLNLDGIPDCVLSGRQGGLVAINPVDGSYLWVVDPALTFPTYNYYFPLFIRDFDKDGVIDIVTTHGGDTVYDDRNKNRSPGFIFVVSGRTGQQLSDRILTPDGHETYSNPVAFNINGNIEAVLFGTGGETIAGSLWAITVHSLQEHVDAWAPNKPSKYNVNKNYFDAQCLSDEDIAPMRPTFPKDTYRHVTDKEEWLAKCPVWKSDTQPLWNPYKVCVYELVAAGKTGTITPPVIIDYNGDGIKDLLVSQFNDHIMMMDGATNTIQWDHHAEDTQSYSIPSPIHFNDDDIPDFLVRFNKGKWMNYDYSYMGVIDGSNGELLWSLNCSLGTMSSAITVKSSKKGHDGMLFMASGCEEEMVTSKRNQRDSENEEVAKDNSCSTAHWGMEWTMCMLDDRTQMRHIRNSDDEDFTTTDVYGNTNHIAGGDSLTPKQMYRPSEVHLTDQLKKDILKTIWEAQNKYDTFPDPWSNTEAFIQNYCDVPYNSFASQLYFLTPNMIEAGKIKPILNYLPYVPKLPIEIKKRHGGDHNNAGISDDAIMNQVIEYMQDPKAVRCSHIILPFLLPTTPVLGDFNNDGKLDAAVSVPYGGYPDSLYFIHALHSPKVSVDAFTIENKLTEVFGTEINDIVEFSSYYSANVQPWSRYMGSKGTCVYDMKY